MTEAAHWKYIDRAMGKSIWKGHIDREWAKWAILQLPEKERLKAAKAWAKGELPK